VAVLIGGRGSRMGGPKSLLRLGGEFLLERVARTAAAVAEEVVLVGAGPVPAPLRDMRRLSDAAGVEGPLAGVLAALRWRPQVGWIVLSCDLPFISQEALEWLIAQAGQDACAVVPHLDSPNQREALFAFYAPGAMALLEEGARRGERSLQRLLAGPGVLSPKVPDNLRAAWTNVNTPEEWAAAAKAIRAPDRRRADRLSAEDLRRGLDTEVMGRRIIALERTSSTNDVAWQEALSGAPEGTVVLAEEQTHGRGRMGRTWYSPASTGLLISAVLRPDLRPSQADLLTCMASVAVAEALRVHPGVPARIRWPNDITIRDRKVAGVLVEGRTLATGSAFVLGIGLNANTRLDQFPQDLRDSATSLALETGREVRRLEVARGLLRAVERWYLGLRRGEYGRIARHWRRLSSTLGRRVALVENGREFRGRVLDLSLEDGLIVRLDAGVTRVFHPARVTLRQLPETWQGVESR